MAHFAKIDNNNIVTRVIVAEQDFINTLPESNKWIQTSYNTRAGIHYDPQTGEPSADQTKALRKNYAGLGYFYDVQRDAFIPPKPGPQHALNEETCQWYSTKTTDS